MKGHIARASTIVAAALLVAGGAVAPAGAAEENHDCDTEFGALDDATEYATFTSRRADQDQAGLIDKATNAAWKFRANKVRDSLQKLEDYRMKVIALDTQNKVQDASAMLEAQDAAVTCVKS